MEKKVRKKRSLGADKVQQPASGMINSDLPSAMHSGPAGCILGIPLNHETAKRAIILSEIIGSPVSKRRRRR